MVKPFQKDFLLLLLGLSIGIGAGLGILFGISEESRDSLLNLLTIENNPIIGSPAPDFELTSLEDRQVKLSDFEGKGVMVNFWATWCTPCRLEMPMIQKYQKRYSDNLVVLAVNLQEPDSDVHIFKNELGLDLIVLLDRDGAVSTLYKVQGLPTSFFIDPEGKFRAIHVGALTEEQFDQYLEKIGVEQ